MKQKPFLDVFMEGLTFTAYQYPYFTLYENKERPELGYIIRYQKEGYYDLLIGDYTIPDDFKIRFAHDKTFLRFGIVYLGETNFKLHNSPVSSFSPASFITVESKNEGVQLWKKGQHFHGIEFSIFEPYFEEVLIPFYQEECISLSDLPHNVTQKYLPLELSKIIYQIEDSCITMKMNRLLLEAKVLECMAIISNEYKPKNTNNHIHIYHREKITIGKDRTIYLSIEDIELINKAHEMITENACNQITIQTLSKMLHLHEQKLKAGFLHIYHMTIWEYANIVRMTTAANLLVTTDMSVAEIANKVGYASLGSFSTMFKKHHLMAPHKFRKENSRSYLIKKDVNSNDY